MTAPEADPRWAELMAPFPQDWIEKLPKVLRRNDDDKGRCAEGSYYTADGHVCGGWHARAVHLDYVGHAGITMRLNDVVGPDGWDWEPVATTEDGLPLISGREFWIRLTIMGVSKYGVGDDFPSSKVAIGDALRNAAMRFGIGTYLWSKSDAALALAAASADEPDPATLARDDLLQQVLEAARAAGVDPQLINTDWAAAHGGQPIQNTTDLGGLELLRDDLFARAEHAAAEPDEPSPTAGDCPHCDWRNPFRGVQDGSAEQSAASHARHHEVAES